MSDIFVSYARSTAAQAQQIVEALRALGYGVWRDDELPAHRAYGEVIEERLKVAKAVVVVWSAEAVKSEWVRSEADRARNERKLVQLTVDGTPLPMPFDQTQCADLSGWAGDTAAPGWRKVVSSIADLVGGASPKPGAAGPLAANQDAVSIAVLPFVNMSSDPEQEYFSDGLSEELLNQLAQLKELRVIGRTSCFAFKGKNEDLRAIGQKLGVAHILEGSVRKAGKRLRITAQLIKCADHAHLWSQTYDRDLDDVFAIQDDVSRAVTDALKVTLGVGQTGQIPGGTRNVEAYDLYLRARALWQNAGYTNMLRIADTLRRAVALDPEFANGWLQLAEALAIALTFDLGPIERMREEQGKALDKVIAIAPGLWAGHAARAGRLLRQGKLFAAEQAYAKAIELGPRPFTEAPLFTALIGGAGRINEAIPYLTAIREVDPLRPLPTLQMFLVLAGRYAEAEAEYARTKEMTPGPLQLADWFAFSQTLATEDRASAKQHLARLIPNSPNALVFNDELFAVFDDSDAAIAWIRRKLADPSQDLQGVVILFAFLAAYFGAHDYALELLRRVFIELRQSAPVLNVWHPVFADVRKAPGFKDLVRDYGLYDYWRESGKWGDFARPIGADDFEVFR